MDQQDRTAARRRWQHAERNERLAGMPIRPELLHRLLEYLDANLESCDHTTTLAAKFLEGENLKRETVLSWLAENGGHCDCEVLANLAELDDSLQKPIEAPRIAALAKTESRSEDS